MYRQDIGITYPSYFSNDFEKKLLSEIEDDRLKLVLQREDAEMWNAIKWTVPGMVSTYIFRPYFEKFLQEAGSEHFTILKRCLSNILRKNKHAFTTSSSKSSNQANSRAILFHIELKSGRIVKLLFDNSLSLDEWLTALDRLLDLVWKHYTEQASDELLEKLRQVKQHANFGIFATINQQTKEWEFLDLYSMLQQEKNALKSA